MVFSALYKGAASARARVGACAGRVGAGSGGGGDGGGGARTDACEFK